MLHRIEDALVTKEEQPSSAEVIVEHRQPRQRLYMPSRLDGEHPRKVLTNFRETHAVNVLTGQKTVVRDNWGGRTEHEKLLSFPWTGWTKFIRAGESVQGLRHEV